MGIMNKLKNLFTEEVEIDEEETPVKKEVIQVEIPAPVKTKREDRHKEVKEEPIESFTEEVKINNFATLDEPEIVKAEKKEEYKFPFFDDEDFGAFKPKKKEKKKEEKKIEAYNPPKIEKTVFKPTPIISPVYGILDKDYSKEDIQVKGEKNYNNPKEDALDKVRDKIFGTLEDDLETTLFGETEENLFEEEAKEEIKEEETKEIPIKEEISFKESELTSLLEKEMDKPEEKKPSKISDEELFGLIDSMYEKGDDNND